MGQTDDSGIRQFVNEIFKNNEFCFYFYLPLQ